MLLFKPLITYKAITISLDISTELADLEATCWGQPQDTMAVQWLWWSQGDTCGEYV